MVRRLLGLVAVVAFTSVVAADTLTITTTRDNTLYQRGEKEEVTNGGGDHFFVGRTNQSAFESRRRGVIGFDIANQIPAGSTIESVTLTLYMSRTSSGSFDMTLHRLLEDWGEGDAHAGGNEGGGANPDPGDATWYHQFYPNTFWSSIGGDFEPIPTATTAVDTVDYYSWSSGAMVSDVQTWLDTPGIDFGWCLVGEENQPQTAKRFDTRENDEADRRPALTVTFTAPGPIGACCMPDGSCIEFASTTCALVDGDFGGEGTVCEPNDCPQPTGACCLADATCVVLTQLQCDAAGGEFQGDGTPCMPGLCVAGACCLSDRSCAELTAAGCDQAGGAYQGDGTACIDLVCPMVLQPFVDPLPIPPVAQPTVGAPGGAATYDIAIVETVHQFHMKLPATQVWAYGGTVPGPTIEAAAGEPVTVNWVNDLRDDQGDLRTDHVLPVDPCANGPDRLGPTPRLVTHLHGGRTSAPNDGHPDFTVLPGETQSVQYANVQRATTLWYHDHALGIARLNRILGLVGAYIIRDDREAALGLPTGEFDIPLVITDRSFDETGALIYPATLDGASYGTNILVNGKVWPFLVVKQGKYRFRLINASNARVYRLSLSTGSAFLQISTDGGLRLAPHADSQLTLAPGERADIVIDFAAFQRGAEFRLLNDAPAPYPGQPGEGVVANVMKFVVGADSGHTAAVPPRLSSYEQLDENDASVVRDIQLRAFPEACADEWWLINGLTFDDVTETPALGATEVWRLINRSGVTQPLHLHGVFFQALDRQAFVVVDDDIVPVGVPFPVAPREIGPKDTVQVAPDQIVRVIARFDLPGVFTYHSQIAEYQDHEMMRQVHILDPCNADLNLDGVVGPADLAALLQAWGPNPGHPADLTGNGIVNAADLAGLLDDWGACP